ncbi:MAG: hypothetical protein Q4C42_00860 [Clostridia bacterium]|nr:hypothetical protein [Clostridia bacterium]
MASYKGEGGAFEIISFTLTDLDESEVIYEGYALEYADEEDIDLLESFDTLEEANSAFYSDEKKYYLTVREKSDENSCVCSYICEYVLCERDSGRILAVSHYLPGEVTA